ncbi:hypothetical protein ON010_g5018 [Phytophthora cinnamomi]|nr:hypothetical protein ON010_g5018 [Phytophthora cinnamomi]
MPTSSEKKRLLKGLQAVWRDRLLLLADTEDSSDEDDEMEFALLYIVLQSQRYVVRRKRVPRPAPRINFYLTRMPDEEFQLKFQRAWKAAEV